MSERLPIDAIQVRDRHRRNLGDLLQLRNSINEVGLLHPVVVTADGRLIAGQRRLEACRALGWAEVPVRRVTELHDARLLLEAERDENTCRLDMTPSEKVALGRALEELERPRAAERKAATQAKSGQRVGEENFSPPSHGERTGKVYDLVGESVGMSGPTYKRAKAVVAAADNGNPVAEDARDEMDRTGKVLPAYKKATGQPVNGHPQGPRPFALTPGRQTNVANVNKQRVWKVVTTTDGLAQALDAINLPAALAATTPEERGEMVALLGKSLAELRRFRTSLQERDAAHACEATA